jgi:hypothetical protein
VKTDNSAAISAAIADGNKVLGGGGCTTSERRVPSGAAPFALLGAGIAAVLLRRRLRTA